MQFNSKDQDDNWDVASYSKLTTLFPISNGIPTSPYLLAHCMVAKENLLIFKIDPNQNEDNWLNI